MRELTFEELAIVAGGGDSDDRMGGWFDSLWDWISDFFGWGDNDPDIMFNAGFDVQVDGGSFVDTYNDPNPHDDPPTTAEVTVVVTGGVEPVDVHTSIEIFGFDIPFLNIHVQGSQ